MKRARSRIAFNAADRSAAISASSSVRPSSRGWAIRVRVSIVAASSSGGSIGCGYRERVSAAPLWYEAITTSLPSGALANLRPTASKPVTRYSPRSKVTVSVELTVGAVTTSSKNASSASAGSRVGSDESASVAFFSGASSLTPVDFSFGGSSSKSTGGAVGRDADWGGSSSSSGMYTPSSSSIVAYGSDSASIASVCASSVAD